MGGRVWRTGLRAGNALTLKHKPVTLVALAATSNGVPQPGCATELADGPDCGRFPGAQFVAEVERQDD